MQDIIGWCAVRRPRVGGGRADRAGQGWLRDGSRRADLSTRAPAGRQGARAGFRHERGRLLPHCGRRCFGKPVAALADAVIGGASAVTVHPRGEEEIRRAELILTAGPRRTYTVTCRKTPRTSWIARSSGLPRRHAASGYPAPPRRRQKEALAPAYRNCPMADTGTSCSIHRGGAELGLLIEQVVHADVRAELLRELVIELHVALPLRLDVAVLASDVVRVTRENVVRIAVGLVEPVDAVSDRHRSLLPVQI